jgi:glutamyl-tRNA synthetase
MVRNVAKLLTDPESPYKEWRNIVGSPFPENYIRSIVLVDAENYTNANEFLYRNAFFFTPIRPFDKQPPMTTTSDIPMRAQMLADVKEEEWNKENLMQKVREIIDGRTEGKKGSKDVYHYLRKTVTGQEQGMRLYDVFVILGRNETLKRLGLLINN